MHTPPPKNPCYDHATHTDCPDRCAGCGATCARWAAYTAERDAMYETRRKASLEKMGAEAHYRKVMQIKAKQRRT